MSLNLAAIINLVLQLEAEALVRAAWILYLDIVNKAAGAECAIVLPMDGFHYSRSQLYQLDPPDAPSFLPRRGAPWTFGGVGDPLGGSISWSNGIPGFPPDRRSGWGTGDVRLHR